jgi:hypothetical protein
LSCIAHSKKRRYGEVDQKNKKGQNKSRRGHKKGKRMDTQQNHTPLLSTSGEEKEGKEDFLDLASLSLEDNFKCICGNPDDTR